MSPTRRRIIQSVAVLPLLCAAPPLWAQVQGGVASTAPSSPPPAAPLSSPGADKMRAEAEALERKVATRTGEVFGATSDEVVVVLSGVVDLALADRPQSDPSARALAYMDLVIDTITGSVQGEIYGLEVEAGEWGALVGAAVPLSGHMVEAAPGQYGVWVSAPMATLGRPTQGTRMEIKADLDLRGAANPRVGFGPVAGTFTTQGTGRKALLGAVALWEVSGTPPG